MPFEQGWHVVRLSGSDWANPAGHSVSVQTSALPAVAPASKPGLHKQLVGEWADVPVEDDEWGSGHVLQADEPASQKKPETHVSHEAAPAEVVV